jgi:hypothetical protein
MKFKYVHYKSGVLRPIIPIQLKRGEHTIGYHVLIDSGADMCVFDASMGRVLGIDISKGKKEVLYGVGGKASLSHICPITIRVGRKDYVIEANFIEDAGNHIVPYGVVGQRGFFEHFKICFDRKKEEIELKAR